MRTTITIIFSLVALLVVWAFIALIASPADAHRRHGWRVVQVPHVSITRPYVNPRRVYQRPYYVNPYWNVRRGGFWFNYSGPGSVRFGW